MHTQIPEGGLTFVHSIGSRLLSHKNDAYREEVLFTFPIARSIVRNPLLQIKKALGSDRRGGRMRGKSTHRHRL
jgi:hypothetical protein